MAKDTCDADHYDGDYARCDKEYDTEVPCEELFLDIYYQQMPKTPKSPAKRSPKKTRGSPKKVTKKRGGDPMVFLKSSLENLRTRSDALKMITTQEIAANLMSFYKTKKNAEVYNAIRDHMIEKGIEIGQKM